MIKKIASCSYALCAVAFFLLLVPLACRRAVIPDRKPKKPSNAQAFHLVVQSHAVASTETTTKRSASGELTSAEQRTVDCSIKIISKDFYFTTP